MGIDLETQAWLDAQGDITLAEMIMSDCGVSSGYAPLKDRIAKRIAKHRAAAEPVNARLLDVLRDCVASLAGYRREMSMLTAEGSDQPCDAEKAAIKAISAAEAEQAEPVWLSKNWIDDAAHDGLFLQNVEQITRKIETAALRANGLLPAEEQASKSGD